MIPNQSLERFRELVLDDPALQARLLATTDEAAFFALAIQLGAERGLHFTAADLREGLRAARRAWLERWIQ